MNTNSNTTNRNHTPWSEADLQTLRQGITEGASYLLIARTLNRSEDAVRLKGQRLKRLAPLGQQPMQAVKEAIATLYSPGLVSDAFAKPVALCEAVAEAHKADEADDPRRVEHWKRQARHLSKELDDLRAEDTALSELREVIRECAPQSYVPQVDCPSLAGRGTGKPQSAVLMFSDTHIGKVVHPGQTLGLGEYNFDIFAARLLRLEESITSILQDHTTTPVEEIVVAMLGDMLDGALNHAAEAGQANTLLRQFHSGAHLTAQFLTRLSVMAPLRIPAVVGNHTRWQNQKKMPTENRNSNYDMLWYLLLQALTRDNPRIAWQLNEQPFALFDVQGHHFYGGHGDNLRGGDKNLGIPNHAIGRSVSVNSQLFFRQGLPLPNYFLYGHLHRPITLPHTNGEVIINGAFPGVDGYSLTEAFNSSRPTQKFFLVHPAYGRSACYDLRLDIHPHGEPYKLPDTFLCA